MNAEKRQNIFLRFQKNDPHPKIELKHKTPFELLVAVLLSAQSTDAGVNKATKKLFSVANTPKKMASLGEEKLKSYIKTIGLYNNKARNLIATCQILINQHRSRIPKERTALEALPGIGRKSTNVILNTAFGEPTIGVDTHVFRVSNRTKLAPGKTVLDVERKLLKITPDEFKPHIHHWLVLHGRYVCTAKKPKCEACILQDLCEFKNKSTTQNY